MGKSKKLKEVDIGGRKVDLEKENSVGVYLPVVGKIHRMVFLKIDCVKKSIYKFKIN